MVGLLENPKVQVIAVLGMGGLGKTFLLQNVYQAEKYKYDHSIWISISKSYSVKILQHDIADQIHLNVAAVSEGRAAELIHGRLEGKKCIIVLDDLWTLSIEDNLIDKLGLPSDEHCKVLVSTRNKEVALNSRAHIYEMKNLSDEESWRLFCAYAFADSEGNKEPQQHLEEVGREIVKQCGNLPLAIKTIAASLFNTTIAADWEFKLSQLKGVVRVNADSDQIMPVLKWSYDSLPARFQACFAYLSFFPEDEEIGCEYLINLWIGEGFIPSGEGQQEVAWSCLYQLADLCLLQLSENTDLHKYCEVHDLLYDLAIYISRENKCAFSVEEASSHASGGTGWCRILLPKKNINDNVISESRPICLRTFSLFQNEEIRSIPANLFTAMRGLRVLDLSWTSISTLHASIGKMRILKVLDLRGTEIEEVPECVRHLKSLLFLVMPWQKCKSLPGWISELKYLQFLECPSVDRMPKGISKLASLRTLRSDGLKLSIEEDEFMRLDDLVTMTQLQELQLDVKHEMELKRVHAQLVDMRCLFIWNIGEGVDPPQFPEDIRAMKCLEMLRLSNFAVPSWICELANLRDLELNVCECSDYSELQRMPNLVRLVLWGNETCIELPKAFGKLGGFLHLCFFFIWEFPELEEGAMACLEKFLLRNCSKVKKVEGLERLKRLNLFNYHQSEGTNEWWETLKEGGEYWNKIKAINPHITISNGEGWN